MDLDNLSDLVEESKKQMESSVRKHAKTIRLQDVLNKLKYLTPHFDEDNVAYLFEVDQYKISVSHNKLHLTGYSGLIDREFIGSEVSDLFRYWDDLLINYCVHNNLE